MATTKRNTKAPAHQEWNELHPSEYGEFAQGDPVKIKGTSRSLWTFQYANLRKDGSLDSYTVFGGTGTGQHHTKEFRSFSPDRVTKVGSKKVSS